MFEINPQYFDSLPRYAKRLLVVILDLLICFVSVAASFWIRLGQLNFPTGPEWFAYFIAPLFALPIFVKFGLYRAIFRYAGWGTFLAVSRACFCYALLYSVCFSAFGVASVPRSIGVLQPILLFLIVSFSRAVARYLFDRLPVANSEVDWSSRRRVLIYGAGAAGRQLAGALSNSAEMDVVGFVDDNSALHGSVLNGKVIHPSVNLEKLLKQLRVDDVLLAIPSASRQKRGEIIRRISCEHVPIRTLPSLIDLAHGRIAVGDLRKVEIEDLLGRDPVPPDVQLLEENIDGKVILVTGAGGSIGSELCRQILKLKPRRLVIFDASEYNLYLIEKELQSRSASVDIVPILGNVQDINCLNQVFANWKPDTVFHAAAYKHVPIVEANVAQGIINNVFGTLNVARIAIQSNVSDFVLISTDKAVRPTNAMGATKRICEMILQALVGPNPDIRFTIVRFGNVLGSSGSVVPLFREQIKSGGPLTITHEKVTRYFMTIPEAAQLVVQAAAMSESGDVFVLDMGSPVKILDLARNMIELSGLRLRDHDNPDGDIEIRFVGLRPGEKLYEELLIGSNPERTSHPRIMKAREHYLPWNELSRYLERLRVAIDNGNVSDCFEILALLVPEYRPSPQRELVVA